MQKSELTYLEKRLAELQRKREYFTAELAKIQKEEEKIKRKIQKGA